MADFETIEEINDLADKLLNEGNKEELKKLAKDNGIDLCLYDAFVAGEIPFLVPDIFTLAAGKIDMEMEKNGELGTMIGEYLKNKALEDNMLAKAICKKGKTLKDVCDQAWAEAKERKKGNSAYVPDGEICLMAKAYYLD